MQRKRSLFSFKIVQEKKDFDCKGLRWTGFQKKKNDLEKEDLTIVKNTNTNTSTTTTAYWVFVIKERIQAETLPRAKHCAFLELRRWRFHLGPSPEEAPTSQKMDVNQ